MGEAADGAGAATKLCLRWALGKKFCMFHRPCPASGVWIQGKDVAGTNPDPLNSERARPYQGGGETVWWQQIPGLNHTCLAASGACPIGRFWRWWACPSSAFLLYHRIPHPAGVPLGALDSAASPVPSGWFQDMLHKIPTKKPKQLRPLTYLKYVLLVMVVLLPASCVNDVGHGRSGSSVNTSAPRAC